MTATRAVKLARAAFTCVALVVGSAVCSDLRSPDNRFDYVIVAPSAYVACASDLARFRAAHDGFSSIVVPFDSILTQFGTCIRPDSALRAFVQCALSAWADPKPRYFLLAGNINTIPSHYEPEQLVPPADAVYDTLWIDEWFVEGGAGPKPAVGRLPAWDLPGLGAMVSKILRYESEGATAWSGRALCLADYLPGDGGEFEYDARALSSVLAGGWPDTITVHVREDSPQHGDPEEFRRIWSMGTGVLVYCGHANPQELSSSNYFSCCDVDSLCNDAGLPLALLGGCDIRFDGVCPSSIPVHLLTCGTGGAIAVVASGGLMYESDTEPFFAAMIARMVGNPALSAGDAFAAAKRDRGSPFILRRYTFLGDPAIHVKQNHPVTAMRCAAAAPGRFTLGQNFPNPFNSSTTIAYVLSSASRVTLTVYDAAGQVVAPLVHADQPAGRYLVRFDASALASGVYFYRLQSGGSVQTKRSILLR